MSSGSYDDFLNNLGDRESEGLGGYQADNGPYIGKYQMGEASLTDIGLVNRDSNPYDNKYTWSKKAKDWGINSRQNFKDKPAVQEQAIRDYMDKQWAYIKHYGLDKYIGMVIGGYEITPSGLLAGAHLVGVVGLMEFLKSNGVKVPTDDNGTKVTEYIDLFGDYDVPFDPPSAINDISVEIDDLVNSMNEAMSVIPRGIDPLVLDLNGDGLNLSSQEDSHAYRSLF